VTQSAAAPGDKAGVTDYEALRAQVFGLGRTCGTSASLLVLLGQGMAAWMARRVPSPAPVPTDASPRVDPRHAALVSALASMAISVTVFKEARA
jgi:hypothetical protein